MKNLFFVKMLYGMIKDLFAKLNLFSNAKGLKIKHV